MEIQSDRRIGHRYEISLPVRIKLIGKNPTTGLGSGNVLNISSRGIAFTSDSAFNVGVNVELSVSWPALLHGSTRVKLVIKGKVIRTDGQIRAVEMLRYEFHTQKS